MCQDVFCRIGYMVGVDDIRAIGEGYAAFITFTAAILLSVVAFFANAAQRKREYRNQNSSQFLASHKDAVHQAMARLGPLDGMDRQSALDFADAHIADLQTVCIHFETASVYISTGYASERVIVRVEKGNLQRVFRSIIPYIERARPTHPTILEYYESLFIRVYFFRFSLLAVFVGLLKWNSFLAGKRVFYFYYGLLVLMGRFEGSYFRQDLAAIRAEMRRLRILRYTLLLIGLWALAARVIPS